jgi:hypothetical protein
MACPFAPFTRLLKVDDEPVAGSSNLTTRLKDGTWEAHREIERSVGVRALMGSFHHGAHDTIRLDRMDHLRFLVMLTCVYT